MKNQLKIQANRFGFTLFVNGQDTEEYERAADARRGASRLFANPALRLIAAWKTSDNGVSYATA